MRSSLLPTTTQLVGHLLFTHPQTYFLCIGRNQVIVLKWKVQSPLLVQLAVIFSATYSQCKCKQSSIDKLAREGYTVVEILCFRIQAKAEH